MVPQVSGSQVNGFDMSRQSILLIIASIDVLAITAALILGEIPNQYFEEEGFITHLSILQLLVVSAFAWNIFRLRIEDEGRSELEAWKAPHFIWLIIAVGFLYLALDEALMVHENMDKVIHSIFRIHETSITDRIDDVIFGLYGLIGLIVLYFYREELTNYREAFPLLKVGFVLMFFSAALDIFPKDDILGLLISKRSLFKRLRLLRRVIEESFKILSEGAFIAAFYYCLEITRKVTRQPPKKPEGVT